MRGDSLVVFAMQYRSGVDDDIFPPGLTFSHGETTCYGPPTVDCIPERRELLAGYAGQNTLLPHAQSTTIGPYEVTNKEAMILHSDGGCDGYGGDHVLVTPAR